jgi:FLYWCH zinc finger domain
VACENRIKFIKSFKGSLQICLNDFPFTRHRVLENTTYWRCVKFKSIGCRARLRTRLDKSKKNFSLHKNFNDESQKVEIVCNQHNHELITERLKKGELKMLKEEVNKKRCDVMSDKEKVVFDPM